MKLLDRYMEHKNVDMSDIKACSVACSIGCGECCSDGITYTCSHLTDEGCDLSREDRPEVCNWYNCKKT